jgi:hypothetical protein
MLYPCSVNAHTSFSSVGAVCGSRVRVLSILIILFDFCWLKINSPCFSQKVSLWAPCLACKEEEKIMPEVFCTCCGKSIQISAFRLARGFGRFCSRSCRNKVVVSETSGQVFFPQSTKSVGATRHGERATITHEPSLGCERQALPSKPESRRGDGNAVFSVSLERKLVDEGITARKTRSQEFGTRKLCGSPAERYLSAGFSLSCCPWEGGRRVLYEVGGGEGRCPDPALGF